MFLSHRHMPIYRRLHGKGHESIYFGFDRTDWGRMSPQVWLAKNLDWFVLPLEALAAARTPFTDTVDEYSEGVYFLFMDEELQYVGQSKEITTRLWQHYYPYRPSLRKADWWNCHAAIWVPLDLLNDVEAFYIRLLRPPRNVAWPCPYHQSLRKLLAA